MRGRWSDTPVSTGRNRPLSASCSTWELQREITEGLDVVEASDGARSVVYYGKGGRDRLNREDEQAVLEKAAG